MTTTQGQSVMVAGRIVWTSGDLFKGKVKLDPNTRQPKIDTKTGAKVIEYGFGLAVPKSSLKQEQGNIWFAMHQEAAAIYPNGMPPSFAMKFKDGDGVDDKGIPFSAREGYAGHIVIACTTQIPIKYFRWENNTNMQVNEGFKNGDYVEAQLLVKAHGPVGQGKPGLYINPMAVRFLGYGAPIVNTPSGDDVFGMTAPVVPQGASATPIGGGQPVMVAMPAPGGFAMPSPAQPLMPAQPHYGVLPNAHQPPAVPGSAAAPVAYPQPTAAMPMPPQFPR